jgi:serine/threonine-protein kinase
MATVHFGRLQGPAGFSRTVAIKRLHPQLAREPEFVSMFIDEMRLAARIQHPNVVATLDVVEEGDELFLVMEYVHGESLGRLIRLSAQRGHAIPPPIATTIICGLLHGLHAAHEARSETDEPLSIVHRDVSPQNVLVGVDGIARVLDFGIAKAVGRLQTTREGQIKGKMAYLAPEHARSAAIDRRTDVYGAAVVLWEALTGVQLFDGENDAIILARVLAGQVPPPSAFVQGLSPALEAIVLRALDREPPRRFATAREMALVLQNEVGVVAPSEVGDWVSDLAAESLSARSQYLSELERLFAQTKRDTPVARIPTPHSVPVPRNTARTKEPSTRAMATPPGADAANGPAFGAPLDSRDLDPAAHSVTPRPVVVRSGPPGLARDKRRRAAVLGATALGGLIAIFAFMGARASHFAGAHATALEDVPGVLVSPPLAPSAVSAFLAASGSDALPDRAQTTAGSVSQAPTTASVPSATATPHARAGAEISSFGGRLPRIVRTAPWTAPPSEMHTAPAGSPAAVGRERCQPPYVVDTAGIKRFKVECL